MTVKLKKVKDYYGDNDFETTRLGFVHDDFFITEPFTSECGRFEVDPDERVWTNPTTGSRNRQI